jgi:hypothetical protein
MHQTYRIDSDLKDSPKTFPWGLTGTEEGGLLALKLMHQLLDVLKNWLWLVLIHSAESDNNELRNKHQYVKQCIPATFLVCSASSPYPENLDWGSRVLI